MGEIFLIYVSLFLYGEGIFKIVYNKFSNNLIRIKNIGVKGLDMIFI